MEDIFEIVRRRYETNSRMITTNRNFEDWGTLFGDKVIASAIIDPIVYHAVIVKLTGACCRVKNLIELQGLFTSSEMELPERGRSRAADKNNQKVHHGDH